MYLYFIETINNKTNEKLGCCYSLEEYKLKYEVSFSSSNYPCRFEYRFVGVAETKEDVTKLLESEAVDSESIPDLINELMDEYILTFNLRHDCSNEASYDWIHAF